MVFTNLDFEKNKDITSSTINLGVCAKELGKIEFINTAQTIDDAYPTINNVGNQTFLLQTDDNIYTLRIVINYISQRLYYHIIDQNNSYIIRFAPLTVWPFNLLSHNTFKDYYLFFQYGTLYFGKLSDYEAAVNQAVYVDGEDLWIDYSKEEENESEDFLLPDTTPKELTELSVTPATLLMDLGKKSLINVKTNAESWSYEFKDPSLAVVDEHGIVTAIESGYTLLKITAQKEGCLASQASISLYISTKGQISQEDKEEILESLKPTTKLEVKPSKVEVEKGQVSQAIEIVTNAEHFSYLIDEKIATFDKETKTITGVEVGETTLQIGATAQNSKLAQTSVSVIVLKPVELEPTDEEQQAFAKLNNVVVNTPDKEGLLALYDAIIIKGIHNDFSGVFMGLFYDLASGDAYKGANRNQKNAMTNQLTSYNLLNSIFTDVVTETSLIVAYEEAEYPMFELVANIDRFFEYKESISVVGEALTKGVTLESLQS